MKLPSCTIDVNRFHARRGKISRSRTVLINMKRRRKGKAHVDGHDGTFAYVRMSGDHVTLAVEGNDSDGPSVAGMSLSLDGVDQLLWRLAHVREALAHKLGRPPLTVARAGRMVNEMHRP